MERARRRDTASVRVPEPLETIGPAVKDQQRSRTGHPEVLHRRVTRADVAAGDGVMFIAGVRVAAGRTRVHAHRRRIALLGSGDVATGRCGAWWGAQVDDTVSFSTLEVPL